MYELDEVTFQTPNGSEVRFLARRGSSDWNTLNSIVTADEYEVAGLHLEGWALDLGAHIGGMAVCLAVDFPRLQVVAVEPVPPNVHLVQINAALNDASVDVCPEALGPGETTEIRWGFRGSESADHHAFIGNASFIYDNAPDVAYQSAQVPCVDLAALAVRFGGPPSFVKLDAEGGEWAALDQVVALRSPRVVGEWHPTGGHSLHDFQGAFEQAGYHITFTGPEGGPGGFLALL